MGTKMFQFPTFASLIPRMTESLPPGCPIRTSAGQWVFAPRRGFSQLVTSFFASESQGIPHAPFSSRCTFQEVCDLLVYFRLAFALPYLAASRCFLELPGASRCGARCVLLLLSARSVALPTPLLQYVNVLVPWFLPCPLGRRQVVFRPVVLGRVELPTSTLSV